MSSTSSADRVDLWSEIRSDVPGTILAALDGSPFAESALAHARSLARALGSRLHLVTVLDPRRTGATSRTSAECRLQRIEATAGLDRVANTLRTDGYDCTFEVREGEPTAEIAASVMERGIELVALAARPRREREGFVEGSVTHGVIASGMPSLLVARGRGRRRGRAGDTPEARYQRIGVAVDGSTASHRALGLAAYLARREAAEIVLMHVLGHASGPALSAPEGPSPKVGRGIRFGEASEAMRYLRVLELAVTRTGAPVRSRLFRSWSAADALEGDADLVVLAAEGSTGGAPGYGSCARRLLLQSRTPVLVLQDRPGETGPAEPWTPARRARGGRRGPPTWRARERSRGRPSDL